MMERRSFELLFPGDGPCPFAPGDPVVSPAADPYGARFEFAGNAVVDKVERRLGFGNRAAGPWRVVVDSRLVLEKGAKS